MDKEPNTYLYTDGAVEENRSLITCGAVLFSPRRKGPVYFGIVVPKEIVSKWASAGSRHVVAQVELLPVVLARATWPRLLEHAWTLAFIDNDSVKAALVSGHTAALASIELLAHAGRQEIELRSHTWYSRVPSPSNVADDPSRLEFEAMKKYDGSEMCEPNGLQDVLELR
jgi:hypothetical protein